MQTQNDGEPLQEVPTAIEQTTHHAFPALHEDHVSRIMAKAFTDGIRERGIRQELHLGGKRTLTKTVRQTWKS
jgi:hypothetical protein